MERKFRHRSGFKDGAEYVLHRDGQTYAVKKGKEIPVSISLKNCEAAVRDGDWREEIHPWLEENGLEYYIKLLRGEEPLTHDPRFCDECFKVFTAQMKALGLSLRSQTYKVLSSDSVTEIQQRLRRRAA